MVVTIYFTQQQTVPYFTSRSNNKVLEAVSDTMSMPCASVTVKEDFLEVKHGGINLRFNHRSIVAFFTEGS